MDEADDDDFGGSEWPDDDLLLVASQIEGSHGTAPPPSKRQCLSPPGGRGDTGILSTSLTRDVADQLSDESDEFDPPTHPIRSGPSLSDRRPHADTALDLDGAWSQPSQPPARGQSGPGPSGLRQTTLLGGTVRTLGSTRQPDQRHTFTVAKGQEAPTHHKLDDEAVKTWVYPTNLGTIRDYQYNVVQRGLFHNLLVALPTGLGKTFIAATIMLNWFRWTKDAQIVFVAPTKPLVAQQVDACFGIVGIPRSQTTMLTGGISPGLRAEAWASKRVFFMTPQTMINDLKSGICDPKRIVCLVVDEAHRATGNYAYVEVVKFIRRFNQSLRVLALTATPGSSVEAVQEVIDGLGVAKVEIRTEESLDIRQYIQRRRVEMVIFDPSEEIVEMKTLFSKALQPVLEKLNRANAYWAKDPMMLTAYGLTQARSQWMNSEAGRNANMGLRGMMNTIFVLLASLAHSITLLNYHGIGPFYHNVLAFRGEVEAGGEKGSKYRRQIVKSPDFQKLMSRAQRWINDPEFIGHPKLAHVRQVVLNHFMDAADGRGAAGGEPPSATRIMIFVHYRDSAEEVVRVLKRNEPMIRPHAFVGQAGAKGSDGMNQKTQLDVIQKFQQGVYNTLVATCVGEEGLDIGEVDLIICYDSSASPIRMLQRMGRTGRKRAGNIVLLLMRGKEEDSYLKAKDGYEKMQQMIAAGTRFAFHEDTSPRILPAEAQPVVDKRLIDIPVENTQADLPEPRRRARAPKRPAKKFHMPDGVRTGFVKASRLQGSESEDDDDEDDAAAFHQASTPVLASVPALDDVLLTSKEEKELARRFQNVYGGNGVQSVSLPALDAFPERQRRLGRVSTVAHGRITKRVVKMVKDMRAMNDERLRQLQDHLHPDDQRDETLRPLLPSAGQSSQWQQRRQPELSPSSPRSHESSSSRVETDTLLDDNDDMNGFVVDDDATPDSATSPTSSPLSLDLGQTRFYVSPKKRPWNDTDTEEDLPDVSVLVEPRPRARRDRMAGISEDEDEDEDESSPPALRRGRRAVVDESEDDEEEEEAELHAPFWSTNET
ncbi:MAG: 3'-5' DNA helicase [Thelocarpon superellum]|nr:MAG: 3'-5' DNA helicase [Thelocarpon superellum]